MIGSLYAAISGLKANANAMTVIGDNIANVNTTGFKSARASFSNIFSQSLGGTQKTDVGRGVVMSGVNTFWAAGSLENTSNETDLSVNGQGMFIVSDEAGMRYYTRAGEFQFDKDGNLVNPDGLIVQGYQIDSAGLLGAMGGIQYPAATNEARATTEFAVGMNLDSGASTGEQYSTALTVYDSLGNAVLLTITATKTATPNQFSWQATVPTEYVGSGNEAVGSGTLTFNSDGTLPDGVDPRIRMNLTNGAATPLDVYWDIYGDDDTHTTAGATRGDLTGYAAASMTTSQSQDGFASGTLTTVSVNTEGIFTGVYSNGTMIPFYQIALANFPSYQGLAKVGNNLCQETIASGQPVLGRAGTSTLGTISPSSLEMSNVDLGNEFVKLISTQRAFQANSRVITTSDEILAELMNIKR